MLSGLRVGDLPQLLQQQRVLEDALDGLDQVRLQRRRVLLLGVARAQELVQRLVVICQFMTSRDSA